MSDVSLYQRSDCHQLVRQAKHSLDRGGAPSLSTTPTMTMSRPRSLQIESPLASLPFDVLLCIAESLSGEDILSLEVTCQVLWDFGRSYSLSLRLATRMLGNSQPLPVGGFQRIMELDMFALARVVKHGDRLQNGWHERSPALTTPYKTIPSPDGETIVWLSPITSKYTLCCTRSGKVICWDVLKSASVAEWVSGDDWEIWKCRVEFDERTVYFALAKKVPDSTESECQIIALRFPEEVDGTLQGQPVFEKLSKFTFPGYVIGVYLLNPMKRLLSAYIYLEGATIGLYVVTDWNIPLYTYINTGISYLNQRGRSREWSCIGYDPTNLVIHDEDHEEFHQYYYPFSLLRSLSRAIPTIENGEEEIREGHTPRYFPPSQTVTHKFQTEGTPFSIFDTLSSHFVRQWWPTLPKLDNMKRSSCTIMLLSFQIPGPEPVVQPGQPVPNAPGYTFPARTTVYTIAQHYFGIPSLPEQLRWWYVGEPFEIVSSGGSMPIIEEEGAEQVPVQEGEDPPVNIPIAGVHNEQAANAEPAAPPPVAAIVPVPNGGPGGPFAALLGEAHALAGEAGVVQLIQEVLQEALGGGGNGLLPGGGAAGGEAAPAADADVANVDEELALAEEEEEEDALASHLAPLIAVDFGCAAWLEYVNPRTEDIRLRFVMFPPVDVDRSSPSFECLGTNVRTLETPENIVLRNVCHIGLDQSQGTIILGLLDGSVYVLRYE